jgi:large subunit ribosomal protein L17
MRHRKKINHLSRTSEHRNAMLGNMAASLIVHKRVTTTTAKAKALRTFIEPIITRSKEDTTHSRRMVFKNLRDKSAVSELFREVASRVAERPGGYTRIIKLDNRLGDSADMCIIELVDFNEHLLEEKKTAAKPKTSRRRRGTKKKESPETTSDDAEMTGAEEKTDLEGTDKENDTGKADSQEGEEVSEPLVPEEKADVQDTGEGTGSKEKAGEPKTE